MWILDQRKKWIFSCLPKCGSRSITSVVSGHRINNEKAINYSQRIVYLKHPFTRLVSNYSFFKIKTRDGSYQGQPDIATTETWQLFIDYILDNDNPHWLPQVDQLSLNGEFLGTVVHKLENIIHTWPRYYHGLLPHLNGTVHQAIDPSYRFTEIKKRYANDFNLWNTLED